MATLSISPVTAAQNTARTITFTGFQPNASVKIQIVGGGYFTATANSSGGGTYSVTYGEGPGDYTLTATDSYNHSASTTFTVAGWKLLVTVSVIVKRKISILTISTKTIYSGGSLAGSFANFRPNASINIAVVGGGGLTVTSNSAGGGSFSFVNGDSPGNYTLKATDSYGNTATDTFTILAKWTVLATITVTVKQRIAEQNWTQLVLVNVAVPERSTTQNWAHVAIVNVAIPVRQTTANWIAVDQVEIAVSIPGSNGDGDDGGGLSTGAAIAIGLGVVGLGVAAAMSQPKVRQKVSSATKSVTTKAKQLMKG